MTSVVFSMRHLKPLSHIAALRLHGVANFPWALWDSSWQLLALSLRSHASCTVCRELSWRANCMCTARFRHSHYADGVLFAFHARTQNLLRIGVLLHLRRQNLRIGNSPVWWCTSVMALNISKTKVMYISSRHKQHIISLTQIHVIKVPLLALVQIKPSWSNINK